MLSFGGLLGSLVAAVVTENYEPRYCFIFSSITGLIIAFVAVRMSVSLETDGLLQSQEDQNKSRW